MCIQTSHRPESKREAIVCYIRKHNCASQTNANLCAKREDKNLPACLPKSIVWTVPHSLASLPLIVVRFLPSASPLNFCLSPSLAIHLSASPSRHVARSETY
ncbi:hypothetical protein S83_066346, partial [Arachis hypogaea]